MDYSDPITVRIVSSQNCLIGILESVICLQVNSDGSTHSLDQVSEQDDTDAQSSVSTDISFTLF